MEREFGDFARIVLCDEALAAVVEFDTIVACFQQPTDGVSYRLIVINDVNGSQGFDGIGLIGGVGHMLLLLLFLMSGTATIAAVIGYCELESVAVPESPLCCAVSAEEKEEFGKSTLKIVPPPAFSEMTILPR